MREHKYSRNSSDDPSITSTRSDKHVSSNARSHPRAELKASDHSHSHRSKHGRFSGYDIADQVECLVSVVFFTPYACARDKVHVIGFITIVHKKIARSQYPWLHSQGPVSLKGHVLLHLSS